MHLGPVATGPPNSVRCIPFLVLSPQHIETYGFLDTKPNILSHIQNPQRVIRTVNHPQPCPHRMCIVFFLLTVLHKLESAAPLYVLHFDEAKHLAGRSAQRMEGTFNAILIKMAKLCGSV